MLLILLMTLAFQLYLLHLLVRLVFVDIANDIGVPVIPFASISPACLWVFLCTPMIIDAGEFGCQGIDLKRMVTSVQGMEGILRKCDLPYLGPGDHTKNQGWIDVLLEIQRLPRTNGLILNTFDDLDGTITLNHLRSHCSNIYCIGPVHQHYKNKLLELAGEVKEKTSNYSNNLWEEDRSCLKWLDEQTPKSAIYVSLGSLGMRTKDKLLELWHGLINSEVMFLWAIRPGSVKGEISGDQELFIEHERSCIVDWVPQEQVLAHPSIRGFFTHSGWGSTMENINAGVPMICWPEYVDQQVTSRLVGKVLNIGVDMKDNEFDRKSVEKMVREVMVTRKLEFQKSAKQFSELARNSITKDGSSHGDMNRLVSDIKMFSITPPKQCEIYT